MLYFITVGDIKSNSLINRLLRAAPYGRPLSLDDLSKYGVSALLAAKYARTGWLERLGPGLYRLPSGRLDRDQCLLVLQKRIKGLHVGGKAALAWQGVRHNVSRVEVLTLWGDERVALPAWFIQEFPSAYRATRLFDDRTATKGLFTPPDVTPGVRVSVRERALLELLRDVGVQQDFEEAHNLFMVVQGLRLNVLGELLQGCTSVKTVRLFLLWARQAGEVDMEKLEQRFKLPTGSNSRWIGKLADGTTLVLPA